MAKRQPNIVKPSTHPKERNLDEPLYISRWIPHWGNPGFASSDRWRTVVNSQPIALVCRETLTSLIGGLDWVIEPRDSNQRDELQSEIQYYTKFFENTGDYDYSEIIEWVTKDTLDLPFGSGVEVGRKYDSPDGRVIWIELLDGATLYPTNNRDYPVAQYVPAASPNPVYFPSHAINRIYMSPRTRIKEKGWGLAPPEKIYLALELINRGDYYYANLLLDTPAAGILDLGDMDQESAKEWVVAWRELLNGIDPYKVPVLYEHEKPANFIPFTKNPTDLNFNVAMMRYAGILVAGYGMSMSDIGLSLSGNGGETLAGTIRDERRTRRTGVSTLKKKLVLFFNRLLPDTLQFRFIDIDDELMVSLGRARLAAATSLGALTDKNMFTPQEGRMQMLADGLITISVPEKLPKELQDKIDNANNPQLLQQPQPGGKTAERPNMLGRPVSPGQGGWGEVAAKSIAAKLDRPNILRAINTVFTNLQVLSSFDDELLPDQPMVEVTAKSLQSIYRSLLVGCFADCYDELLQIVNTKSTEYVRNEIESLYITGDIDSLEFDATKIIDVGKQKDLLQEVLENAAVEHLSKSLASETVVSMIELFKSKSVADVFDISLSFDGVINDSIAFVDSQISVIINQSLIF